MQIHWNLGVTATLKLNKSYVDQRIRQKYVLVLKQIIRVRTDLVDRMWSHLLTGVGGVGAGKNNFKKSIFGV